MWVALTKDVRYETNKLVYLILKVAYGFSEHWYLMKLQAGLDQPELALRMETLEAFTRSQF